ncbi:hypothetical protein [Pseudomonas sp. MF6747]|uniref:hypothetical protein n=1 Tax=Pseudomonas sp. MF6747 TaxID=2797527 RepID=UPI00190B0034|nr:hypothetical protein [Pseudomonas sp. MF6747]MBK3506635.1 hypothetical protein [Pseudomonas sp. MF6747]
MKEKKEYATELTEMFMGKIKSKFDKDILLLSFDYDIEKDYSEIETKIATTLSNMIEQLKSNIKLSILTEIDLRKSEFEFINAEFVGLLILAKLRLSINPIKSKRKSRILEVKIILRETIYKENRLCIYHTLPIAEEISNQLYGIMPKSSDGKIKFVDIKKRHELLTRVKKNDKGENILRTGSQYSHIAHLLSKEKKNSKSIPVWVIYNIGYGNNCIKRYL